MTKSERDLRLDKNGDVVDVNAMPKVNEEYARAHELRKGVKDAAARVEKAKIDHIAAILDVLSVKVNPKGIDGFAKEAGFSLIGLAALMDDADDGLNKKRREIHDETRAAVKEKAATKQKAMKDARDAKAKKDRDEHFKATGIIK